MSKTRLFQAIKALDADAVAGVARRAARAAPRGRRPPPQSAPLPLRPPRRSPHERPRARPGAPAARRRPRRQRPRVRRGRLPGDPALVRDLAGQQLAARPVSPEARLDAGELPVGGRLRGELGGHRPAGEERRVAGPGHRGRDALPGRDQVEPLRRRRAAAAPRGQRELPEQQGRDRAAPGPQEEQRPPARRDAPAPRGGPDASGARTARARSTWCATGATRPTSTCCSRDGAARPAE